MDAIDHPVVAVGLYFFSDWLIDRLEQKIGRRFEHRTLYFFATLVTLALLSFAAIRQFAPGA